MAVSPNTNFTSGQILTAAQQNNFPRGLMGYVVRTTGNISLTTTLTDVTGASVAFTAVANRGYKVSFSALVGKTGSNGQVDVTLADGSNNALQNLFIDVPNGEFQIFTFDFLVTTLTAGAQTLKIRAKLSTAGGTLYAAGGNNYSYTVEDVGPI
jgi:hypothetical protein